MCLRALRVGGRWWSAARPALVLALVVGLLPLVTGPASAAVGTPTTYQGDLYAAAASGPSADKPQSKLWFNAGSWWALMVNGAGTVNIFKLDRASHKWSDTGTVVDERTTSTGDALWTNG